LSGPRARIADGRAPIPLLREAHDLIDLDTFERFVEAILDDKQVALPLRGHATRSGFTRFR
jgi:hypothetical protein